MHKYRLISKKGEGTFSEVLKAQSIKNGQYTAIKCMKNHFDNIDQVNNLREIQALQRLSPNPHIVKLYEVLYDQPTGRLALVFELMSMNVYELIRGRRHYLPENTVKLFMYQLIKAMDHMHRNGIFHRDIKPENILIRDDLLKVADFGSCRGIYSKQPYTEYISTRWYRAPECLLTDGYYGYKMDMWGVGSVMFEVIALYPLFPGTNELDQIQKIHQVLGTPDEELLAKFKAHGASHIDFNFPQFKGNSIAKMIPHVSSDCVDLIVKLIKYEPEQRLSARQALRHPWFRELREAVKMVHRGNTNNYQNSAVQKSSTSKKPMMQYAPVQPAGEASSSTAHNTKGLQGVVAPPGQSHNIRIAAGAVGLATSATDAAATHPPAGGSHRHHHNHGNSGNADSSMNKLSSTSSGTVRTGSTVAAQGSGGGHKMAGPKAAEGTLPRINKASSKAAVDSNTGAGGGNADMNNSSGSSGANLPPLKLGQAAFLHASVPAHGHQAQPPHGNYESLKIDLRPDQAKEPPPHNAAKGGGYGAKGHRNGNYRHLRYKYGSKPHVGTTSPRRMHGSHKQMVSLHPKITSRSTSKTKKDPRKMSVGPSTLMRHNRTNERASKGAKSYKSPYSQENLSKQRYR